jgi:hypothetical protein
MQIYHRFIINNQYEIVPIIKIFKVQPYNNGVLFSGSINPEIMLGIAF